MPDKERTLREAFLVRLTSKFYVRLRRIPFLEGWGVNERWELVDSVLKAKIDDINNYLDTHEVTLKNAEQAIDEIVKEILIPELENIRI